MPLLAQGLDPHHRANRIAGHHPRPYLTAALRPRGFGGCGGRGTANRRPQGCAGRERSDRPGAHDRGDGPRSPAPRRSRSGAQRGRRSAADAIGRRRCRAQGARRGSDPSRCSDARCNASRRARRRRPRRSRVRRRGGSRAGSRRSSSSRRSTARRCVRSLPFILGPATGAKASTAAMIWPRATAQAVRRRFSSPRRAARLWRRCSSWETASGSSRIAAANECV